MENLILTLFISIISNVLLKNRVNLSSVPPLLKNIKQKHKTLHTSYLQLNQNL